MTHATRAISARWQIPVTVTCAAAVVLSVVPACVRAPASNSDAAPDALRAGDGQPVLTDFELTTSMGSSFQSVSLRGRVWIASYFFTQCGANCRQLNMKLSKLSREYGPRGVQFVSISCDPQNDTPATLAEYAEIFNADPQYWTFLTGELPYLQRVGADMFAVSVTERAHFARITIMDQTNRARGTFDVLDPAEFRRATTLLNDLLDSDNQNAGHTGL